MKEDFLHYVWKFQKFEKHQLRTQKGETLQVFQTGFHNQNQSGPDFFNAKLTINQQLWAGNVEIHINASDWYAHHHESDPAYDNVILHVVWNHDVEVYRNDGSEIPCLSLKNITQESTLIAYQSLMKKELRWINCEHVFSQLDDSLINLWLERLFVERLEVKASSLTSLARELKYDWEAITFCWMAKSFGLNVNGDYFLSLAKSIPFKLVQQYRTDLTKLEALFLGQANLLSFDTESEYANYLFQEYLFLKEKHKLSSMPNPPQFFRLRPLNFPSVRLVQLASLYHKNTSIFDGFIKSQSKKEIQEILDIEVSTFWKTHYHINAPSKNSTKRLSSKTIDLFIINSIVPLQFAYQTYLGNSEFSEAIWNIMLTLASEKNAVVDKFNQLKSGLSKSAMESQALLHLKKNYCDKLACLKCAIGIQILKNNDTRS